MHLFVHFVGAGEGAVKLLDRGECVWQQHESPGSSCCCYLSLSRLYRERESVGEHVSPSPLLSLAFK